MAVNLCYMVVVPATSQDQENVAQQFFDMTFGVLGSNQDLTKKLLIFATYDLKPDIAFNLLTGIIAYLMTVFFGFFLGLGILILRLRGPPQTELINEGQHSAARQEKLG
ncbi:hypothetical protein VTI28DRAFT_646 [Corynascus sepedonium]